MNCLSGNIFTNRAIYTYSTNITSCFRKRLTDCINNHSIKCQNGNYGEMDPALFQSELNILINDTLNNTKILTAIQSNIALDNINITILTLFMNNNLLMQVNNGSILIVDSYVMNGYDIAHNNQSCELLQNDRLFENIQYISLLSLNCQHSATKDYYIESMSSAVTNYVDHLTQSRLTLSIDSSYYYPGKILLFTINYWTNSITKYKRIIRRRYHSILNYHLLI